ncbi:MAG: hypothetical protein N2318_02120 [Meiothermus sp.]|nr:hypothetical protein [Meiothermus sp.]
MVALKLLGKGGRLRPRPETGLSPKMRQVLRALASGQCHQSIAKSLRLSLKRVYNIVSDLKFYLGAESQADLLLKYLGFPTQPAQSQEKNSRTSREIFPSQTAHSPATLPGRKEVHPALRELTRKEMEETLGGATEPPPSLPWLVKVPPPRDPELPPPWGRPIVPVPRPGLPEE